MFGIYVERFKRRTKTILPKKPLLTAETEAAAWEKFNSCQMYLKYKDTSVFICKEIVNEV